MDPIIQCLALYDRTLATDHDELVEEHLDHLALARRRVRRFVNIKALSHILHTNVHLLRGDPIQALFYYFI